MGLVGLMGRKGMFFFEKKNQKTFIRWDFGKNAKP